jgi:hypothetical protein
MRVYCGSGTFCPKQLYFIFRDRQTIPENEDVLSPICQGCCVQGPFWPKDRFVRGTFHYKISGTWHSGTEVVTSGYEKIEHSRGLMSHLILVCEGGGYDFKKIKNRHGDFDWKKDSKT